MDSDMRTLHARIDGEFCGNSMHTLHAPIDSEVGGSSMRILRAWIDSGFRGSSDGAENSAITTVFIRLTKITIIRIHLFTCRISISAHRISIREPLHLHFICKRSGK